MHDPVILSLDTATLGGSVYLGRGTTKLAARTGDPKVSQSASLLKDINDILGEAQLDLSEVELFACAAGPGSFTGLRIGIATLKGLAASLERPCLGIPTLHAVAHAAGPSLATVALLPAGRGEVFAQLLSVDARGVVRELDQPAHLSPQKLLERYASQVDLTWAGACAQLQRDLLAAHAQAANIHFAEAIESQGATGNQRGVWSLAPPQTNLAEHVAALALELFQNRAIQSPHSLSAIYVRPSDAELNQTCR
ncbi:MAG TPA: tRNA (adenosine(37)-N6)-threonylcarbamoyltransferase complex dimerization subunit type 1 TsaB [Pyrinomonadaceae bacterium]|jgi:tRNA threonylcarbamoyladenosine biosynthesis protein TsaB